MIQFHSVALLEEFTAKARIQIVVEGSGAADIKAFFELKRFSVDRIVRTAIGHLTLRGLKPGSFRYLTPTQALALVNQPELGERSIAKGKVASADRARINEARRDGVDLNKPKIMIRTPSEDQSGTGRVRIEKVQNPGNLLGRPMGRTSERAKREFEIKRSERPAIRPLQKPKRSYGAEREDRERNSFGGRDERPKSAWAGDREARPAAKRSFGPKREDGPVKRSFSAGREDRPKRSFGGGSSAGAERPATGTWGVAPGPRKPIGTVRDARTSSADRPPRREFGAGYKPRGGGSSERGGFKPKRPPRR